jgi:membrane protein YqaA with SNARE-associated domain
MKRKNNILVSENRFFYLALFVFSALLLISPLYLKFDLGAFKSLGLLGIAIFNFISSSTLFFPAPGILITGIGGALYNPVLVALASALGSSLGECVGFIFGHSSRKITHPKDHTFMESLYKIIHHKHGSLLIVLFAFIPNPFFDAVGIIAGLALFPLKRFLVLVFIGRFLRSLIVAYVGQNLAYNFG